MRVYAVLVAFLVVLSVGRITGMNPIRASAAPNGGSTAPGPMPKQIPRLIIARLKNLGSNKLIVTGENFNDGATIRTGDISEIALKTRNDTDSPSTTLIAKKGGEQLPLNQYFGLIVQNSNGEFSLPLNYIRNESFWALALPGALYPLSVNLHVGDYLVVRELGRATDWGPNSSMLTRVFNLSLPSDEDFAFQAVQPGVMRFYAEIATPGGPPPLVLYSNGIIIE